VSALAQSAARVAALAGNSVRQAIRDRILSLLGGFCAVLVVASVVISELTVGERNRIVVDLSLSAIAMLTTLSAALVTIGQVAREIERRTVDTILSKPVARWELVAGRAGGMAVTLAVMVVAMGALSSVVLVALGGFTPELWKALYLGWLEAVLVAALALFFSTFTTSMPSLFITLGLVVIGHTSDGLLLMAARVESPALAWLLRTLHLVIPNLDLLTVRDQVVWGVTIPWGLLGWASAYALGVAAALVTLGAAILSRRDLA
jgi:ABC-type transport system involved in multi-copper enzyme maturation permease subunit